MIEPIVTREIPPLPDRPDDAHKGDVGRLVVIGGCAGPVMMVGAPALAAGAAFRTGAGLVQLVVPPEIMTAVAPASPLSTTRALFDDPAALAEAVAAFRADVLAIGPGLGNSISAATLVELLARFDGPVVLDADALNMLAAARQTALPKPERIVMTPHPVEASRLLAGAGLKERIGRGSAQRRRLAVELVEAYRCTVVLKGANTVVTDAKRVYVNETGNSGMATAGTGDVLTGMIAALLGQKMSLFDASMLGVYLHGLAGDFAAEELGRHALTAYDLVDYLPDVFREHDTELE